MGAVWEYGPLLLRGVGVTLAVSLASLALAVTLGVLGALAKLSASRALCWTASAYTAVIRSIPDLCLLLLIYFGGQELVNPHRGCHRAVGLRGGGFASPLPSSPSGSSTALT